MKRLFAGFMVLVLLFSSMSFVFADNEITVDAPSLIRPGKAYVLKLNSSLAGEIDIILADKNGDFLSYILKNQILVIGENKYFWNFSQDTAALTPKGEYMLKFTTDGKSFNHNIIIGDIAPNIERIALNSAGLEMGNVWQATINVNMDGVLSGTLKVDGTDEEVLKLALKKGENLIEWDGKLRGSYLKANSYMLKLQFADESGFLADAHYVAIKISEPYIEDEVIMLEEEGGDIFDGSEDEAASEDEKEENPVQASVSTTSKYLPPTTDEVPENELGSNFWKLPAGKLDEEAIWKVMMQPITVIDGKDQRQMYKLRKTPDKSLAADNIVGEVTFLSQGVHILETLDNGWTHIEAYNSSYGPTFKRKGYGNPDDIMRGYVETSLLKQITPREDYGLLIDKLTQRMYVFQAGKIIGELVVSTGLPNAKQPWNETPSGEYLMVSKVGQFNSGNLVCPMAMRINGGMLIHEVPYIYYADRNLKDYSAQVAQLGFKASHGCIRVQRSKNEQGMNMTWLWNNIKLNTKVLVWDDEPRRYTEYPEDDMKLYFNPNGGKLYHANQNCLSVAARLLPLKGSFTYGELGDSSNAKLTPCPYCSAPHSRSEIDELNRKNGFLVP